MGKVTARQRSNLLSAKEMWLKVPERNVSPRLANWRIEQPDVSLHQEPTCETIACFGGWCAWHPPFVAQGLYANVIGAPRLAHQDRDMSFWLFGVSDMFWPPDKYSDTSDVPVISDWQFVMDKINARLASTEVQAS